jgi:predicted DNA-binding ribbon-helix-helix protein
MSTGGHDDSPLKMADDTLDGDRGKSRVIKRSIVVGHHKTSVSLEEAFWNELRAIARERKVHLSELVDEIDSERTHSNLSSAIRLFVFDKCRRSN